MRRRYAYRSSSISETSSITFSEWSELSELIDAYFDWETPFQLVQVVEEQMQPPVLRQRRLIREFVTTSFTSTG